MNKIITLDGDDLTIEEILTIVENDDVKVSISEANKKLLNKSREFLEKKIKTDIVYGVNTGFGPMADHVIGEDSILELQENLILSHAVGMGTPINRSFVLASMVVRLNTIIKGYSGISNELAEQLVALINNRIIPVVPEHGAVGTSGDLVQLAHIALAVLGRGDVWYQGKMQRAEYVFKKLNIKKYRLKAKEGLALINGTAVMSGISAVIFNDAKKLLSIAVNNGAFALELVEAFDDSFSSKLHQLRPHTGQIKIAEELSNTLSSSGLIRKRSSLQKVETLQKKRINTLHKPVQEVYSFRCIAQILGPIFDALMTSEKTIQTEINSVTDNPIIDWENEEILHGGNFHGEYIAAMIDQLKISIVKLSMLSERRINFFLNHNLNKKFPPFLNLKTPGLTLGLQGLQFVATSTAAQNQSLAFPHHVHSIPTNADNQDVVSMGTDAALFTEKVIENSYIILAIEQVVLAQAYDCNKKDVSQYAESSQKLVSSLRAVFKTIKEDRELTQELSKIVEIIRTDTDFNMIINE